MPPRPYVPRKITVSIGLLARNEQSRLPATLTSLFRQNLFAELDRRGERAEIWCVANACTDDTAAVAEWLFHEQRDTHPHAAAFCGRAVSVTAPGKINAWNVFVHEIAARETRCLILMDADIRLGDPATLWNLCRGLEENPDAYVTVGDAVKDLALKPDPSLSERLSLATSRLTRGSGPQLTGQLYCVRADIARRIRLPRDLGACEDGFIKNIVCTDFLSPEPGPARLVRVAGASHIFEAYTTAGAILRNQKRQMIGQTLLHLLLDQYLPACRDSRHSPDLAGLVRQLDEEDPDWLRRLVRNHLQASRHFWRLFPGVCTFRFTRWARQKPGEKLRHLPATLVGSVITVIAAWLARRALVRGHFGYWPERAPGPADRIDRALDLAHPAASA